MSVVSVLVGEFVSGTCVGGDFCLWCVCWWVSCEWCVCVCVLVGKLGGCVCWWVSCECVYVGV